MFSQRQMKEADAINRLRMDMEGIWMCQIQRQGQSNENCKSSGIQCSVFDDIP
jgi:hypothetical protein